MITAQSPDLAPSPPDLAPSLEALRKQWGLSQDEWKKFEAWLTTPLLSLDSLPQRPSQRRA